MNDDHLFDTENFTDKVNIAIQRYKNLPSIVAIPCLVTRKVNFSFSQVTYETIGKQESRYQEDFSEYRYSKRNNKRKL